MPSPVGGQCAGPGLGPGPGPCPGLGPDPGLVPDPDPVSDPVSDIASGKETLLFW